MDGLERERGVLDSRLATLKRFLMYSGLSLQIRRVRGSIKLDYCDRFRERERYFVFVHASGIQEEVLMQVIGHLFVLLTLVIATSTSLALNSLRSLFHKSR